MQISLCPLSKGRARSSRSLAYAPVSAIWPRSICCSRREKSLRSSRCRVRVWSREGITTGRVITSRHGKKPGPRARAICRLPGRRSRGPCQRCIVKKGAGTAKNHQARIHKHPPRGSDDQPAILISGTSGESLNAPPCCQPSTALRNRWADWRAPARPDRGPRGPAPEGVGSGPTRRVAAGRCGSGRRILGVLAFQVFEHGAG